MPHTTPHLTPQQLVAVGRELDALREEVLSDLGEEDAAHIRAMVRLARGSSIAGRTLLALGFTPVSFGAGVSLLAAAKILENMEIGHNVLHAQYDWMNDPTLDSRTYEWDIVCDASQWRHYHNYEHHTFTNVLGKDRDVGYGLVRISEDQYWSPKHLFQPLSTPILALLFQWGVAIHDMDPTRVLFDRRDDDEARRRREEFPAKWAQVSGKAARQLFKDYVLFPLLTPWNAPRVFLGNLAANGLRNVCTNVIIFCGHFPEGARTFSVEETEGESRGGWYLRQLLGSANIEGPGWFHVMSGHLSHQIEHHLFPDLPAWRYPGMAPRVREICERFGLPYNTGSFAEQYGSVLAKILRFALPTAAKPDPIAA
jgi:fatty acid desaturase